MLLHIYMRTLSLSETNLKAAIFLIDGEEEERQLASTG